MFWIGFMAGAFVTVILLLVVACIKVNDEKE
jgi:hypothetical protein